MSLNFSLTFKPGFMNQFNDACDTVHATNVEKGFWDMGVENRSKSELLALMHSEISEAHDAIMHFNTPDEKVPHIRADFVELADCIIRIMDYNSAFELNMGYHIIAVQTDEEIPHMNAFTELECFSFMHKEISDALEILRKPETGNIAVSLSRAVILMSRYAKTRGGKDLLAQAVIDKAAYNTGRPFMHGGKKF